MFHASELLLFFGKFPAVEQELATQMADFYVRFVVDLHPGGQSTRATAPCASFLMEPLVFRRVAPIRTLVEECAPAHAGQRYGHPRRFVSELRNTGPSDGLTHVRATDYFLEKTDFANSARVLA